MKITIISTEKINSKYTREAINEYTKRISAFSKIEYIITKNSIQKLPQRAYIVEVNPEGNNITSEELASQIDKLMLHGNSHIVFLLGVSANVSSDFSLSISKMDIDSDILSIILYEQIYRAFTILNGRPYHK